MMLAAMKMILVLLLMKFGSNARSLHNEEGKQMVTLLRTCFPENLKTIITTPNISQVFFEASWDSVSMSIILIDETFKQKTVPHLKHLTTYVLELHSLKSYGAMLQTVKASPWWHIDTLYFIVGNSRDGCKPAGEILIRSWKMNLLSSWFFCYEQNKGMMLYTYNPYTNRAPASWSEIEEFDGPDDRWTLYAHQYHEGRRYCTNLNYDKTKFMDGYEIKGILTARPGAEWIENKIYNIDSLMDKHPYIVIAIYLQTLIPAMNLTAIIKYNSKGYFHNGEALGFLADVINGSYDIALSGGYLIHNADVTYPFMEGGARILTQQRNFLSPEEKISSFYSTEIKYLTGIVLVITFAFILMIYKERKFAMAAFDVLRLLLSSSLFVSFEKIATKCFFFGIFQLIIILNATFQGHLSAFLTKPERHYVNNLEDLNRYQYNICAPIVYKDYLDEMRTETQAINFVPGIDCNEYVINDSSVACIETQQIMMESALKHKLHISTSTLKRKYVTFLCRKDWPVKKKVDRYASHLIETGFFQYLIENIVNIPLKKLTSREIDETSARYRPIKLDDLMFAFRLLAIGLGTSILSFVFTMLPWNKFFRVLKRMEK